MSRQSRCRIAVAVFLLVAGSLGSSACMGQGSPRQRHRGGMMGGGMPMMMGQASADTAAAPRPAAVAAESTGSCPAITQPLVDQGRQIFGGAGNCYACHGPNAAGTAAAPNLTDSTWLDADGSYGSIIALIRAGVPQPKRFPAPMPAEGGAALDDGQVCAVAAYVRSLGR